MIVNAAELMPRCRVFLMATYGDAGEEGGPYSHCSYIRALLKPNEEGDFLIVYLISLMWQVKLTILKAEPGLAEVRLRHEQTLAHADVVLVYNNRDHFSTAGTTTL